MIFRTALWVLSVTSLGCAAAESTTADASATVDTANDAGLPDGAIATEGGCSARLPALVEPGGSIERPTGSVLRLGLVYVGSEIVVASVRGVEMTLPPSVGPFAPGVNSGYWYELRDGSSGVLYAQTFRDPTILEVPGSVGASPSNATRDRCTEKPIEVDVPNDPTSRSLIVFGSAYGSQGVASELARFSIR